MAKFWGRLASRRTCGTVGVLLATSFWVRPALVIAITGQRPLLYCRISRPSQRITELPDRMTVSPATALRYLRKGVTLPDGRQIEGHAPGVAGATLPDHELRDELARQLNGMTEAVLPYGRADVLTKSSGVRD